MTNNHITPLLLLLLPLLLRSSIVDSWDQIYTDPTGCIRDKLELTHGSYLLNCQGDVAFFEKGSARINFIHQIEDTNYFPQAGLVQTYLPDVHLLLLSANISTDGNYEVWSSSVTDPDYDWIIRSSATVPGTTAYTALLPFISNGDVLVFAGKETGEVVFYDPLYKEEPFQFDISDDSCGPVTSLYITENVRANSLTDFYSINSENGCILWFETQSDRSIAPAQVLQAPDLLLDLLYKFYRVGISNMIIITGRIPASKNLSAEDIQVEIIGSPVPFAPFILPDTKVNDMIIAQSSLNNDIVVFGLEGGDVYTYSLTDLLNGESPVAVCITNTILPYLSAPVLSLVGSAVADPTGKVDYLIFALKENGIVQAYNFTESQWTVIGSAANWEKGLGEDAAPNHLTVGYVLGNLHLMLYWEGGIYIWQTDNTIIQYPPFLDSSTFRKAIQRQLPALVNYLEVSSMPINDTISWTQLKGYVDRNIQLKLTLADSSNSTSLALSILGYDTNSQSQRSDMNKVVVATNLGLANETISTILYTTLFNYNYMGTQLIWTDTQVVV